jgi:hypothetical protein
MCQRLLRPFAVLLAVILCWSTVLAVETATSPVRVRLTVEPGHRWTPPFGLGRVGRPLEAVVEIPDGAKLPHQCLIVQYRDGKEIGRQSVAFMENARPRAFFGRVVLDGWPTEVALLTKADPQSPLLEVARAAVKPPAFEAEAVARAVTPLNPVDLGTILVPADWLLLAGGQQSEIEIAALDRGGDAPDAAIHAWYESAADKRIVQKFPLSRGQKACAKVAMCPAAAALQQDQLHVAVVDGAGKQLWRKDVHVMLVPEPPKWPAFGAVATKLRYDLPILCDGGKTIAYENGWDPKLQDVVVFLPGGGRFVFWRAASYCPFWAGQSNVGLSHEWAEREPPADDYQAIEPLMDKELRYNRVEIVESTAARVHVRWRYQPCYLSYRTVGDSAVEDYYFYLDGFAVRTLTVTCDRDAHYELNEFIVIRPPMACPLDVLSAKPIELLWPDGGNNEIAYPCVGNARAEFQNMALKKGQPPIFRVHFSKSDPLAVFQYSPWTIGPTGSYYPHWDTDGGLATDSPERGAMVSPTWSCNWWPLARGGGSFETSPGTSCLATSAFTAVPGMGSNTNPVPIRAERFWTRDALGKLKAMRRATYTWLIGMTDAGDDRLRGWARSFAQPPAVEVRGARLNPASYYAQDRRALCLEVDAGIKTVDIVVSPAKVCVNPVFELRGAPKTLARVQLDGKLLESKQYAWDGQTFWLDAVLERPTTLQMEFSP